MFITVYRLLLLLRNARLAPVFDACDVTELWPITVVNQDGETLL